MKAVFYVAAAAAWFTLAGPPALAHEDTYLDTQHAPHGGQLRMAGPYHYELVAEPGEGASKDGALVVYVTDHAGAPVSTQGAQGVANVLAGKERSTLTLAPDGENRMKGIGRYAWGPEAKVVVSITLAGVPPAQARFTPGAGGASSSAATSHRTPH